MKLDVILPLIALIIGWSLNELSRYFGITQKRSEAINQAIYHLLQIRLWWVNFNLMIESLKGLFENDTLNTPELKQQLRQIIPAETDDTNNYSKSIKVISSFNPILALKLSTTEYTINILHKMQSEVKTTAEEDKVFLEFLTKREDDLVPYLDEAIIELAKKQGLIIYFKTRNLLKQKITMSEKNKSVLEELKANLEKIKKQA